jgi:alpha 1,3-glucosidase
LYNLDVFEYELDNPMALYGSIPFMTSHTAQQSAGVFFLNSAEMWIDVNYNESANKVRMHPEGGMASYLSRGLAV